MSEYPFAIIANTDTPDWDEVEVCAQVDAFTSRAVDGAPVALVTSLSSCAPLLPADLIGRLLAASITRLCIVYESGWPGVVLTAGELAPGVDFSLRIVKAPLPTVDPQTRSMREAGDR